MANITTQTIRVDLSTDKVIPSAFTHQGDTARTLEFSMYNYGTPYDMTGNTVKFAYKSPIVDSQYTVITGSQMASGTVSGNKVTVTLPVAYTAISGVGLLTMIITPTSGTVRPVNIRLVVQKSADGSDTIGNASDMPDYLDAIAEEYYSQYVTKEVADVENAVNLFANSIASENQSATVICDIGKAKEDTIITASTGIDRAGTGSGNSWCTEEFIRIPKTDVYIQSKSASFGIIGYDANFERVDDIHGESELLSGTYVLDNEQYGFDYIRLNLYHASGYTADRHSKVSVVYYTDAKYDDFIHSQHWGFMSTNTVDGITNTVPSSNRVGMIDFAYAEKPIQIIRKASSNYKYGIVLCKNSNLEKLTSEDWMKSYSTDAATVIPKGAWYWIGFCLKSESADITLKEILNLSDITIRELDDGELGFFSFSEIGMPNVTAMARTGYSDLKYADDNLLLQVESGYIAAILFYTSSDWYAHHWKSAFDITGTYTIPKGLYYRYTVGAVDYANNPVSEQNKEIIFHKAKLLPLEYVKDRIIKQAYGVEEYVSRTNLRLAELESASGVNVVPSYYESHIQSKAATINSLKNAHTQQFFFITDTHVNGYRTGNGRGNQLHSHALLNYLCQHTSVNKLFDGGDMYNSGTGMTNSEATEAIRKAVTYTQPDYGCKRYFVLGNHDTGYDWISGTQYTSDITPERVYELCGNDSHLLAVETDFKSRAGYYFDDGDVRYIVSNMGLNGFTGESNGYTWGFIADTLRASDGKKIVIVQHIMWQSYADSDFDYRGQAIADLADAYNARDVGSFEPTYNATRDFSDCTGEVVCIVCGHMHMDRDTTTTGGIPVIATTTDNAEAESPTTYASRDGYIGTINEQAFDVFTIDFEERTINTTRIGFGEDREFDFPSNA